MNGKRLRNRHRAAMFREGGLVHTKDGQGKVKLEKTDKYIPLRAWLRSQGNKKVKAEVEEWLRDKRRHRPRGRIKGPKDPNSPRKQRNARIELAKAIERAERKWADKSTKADKAS